MADKYEWEKELHCLDEYTDENPPPVRVLAENFQIIRRNFDSMDAEDQAFFMNSLGRMKETMDKAKAFVRRV